MAEEDVSKKYGERNIVKDAKELTLGELTNLVRLEFGLNEQDFQNRDKIKVLVQTVKNATSDNDTENSTSNSPINPTHETWMDVELGYLPYGEKHRDTQFSNKLLKSYYPLVRNVFQVNTCRQWNISKKREAIETSYQFLKTKNMASIGNRPDEGYIPKPNDENVLAGVAVRLGTVLVKIKTLIAEIGSHDQSLFETNGRCLKKNGSNFITILMEHLSHHFFNWKMKSTHYYQEYKRLQQSSITFMEEYYPNGAAIKRRKNNKNKKRKQKSFEKNVEQLVTYLLTEDGKHMLKQGLVVEDCDIKGTTSINYST